MVDLHALTSLDQLLFYNENVVYFFTKQATLMRRSTVLSLPQQLVFPDLTLSIIFSFAQSVFKNAPGWLFMVAIITLATLENTIQTELFPYVSHHPWYRKLLNPKLLLQVFFVKKNFQH
jgi:hypothetical protein